VLFLTELTRGVLVMADRYSQDRREWLFQIGRRLRLEYDDVIAAAPLPERLAALLKQLEEAAENPRQAA
jgi:anti-sigma factor NepR-like protein